MWFGEKFFKITITIHDMYELYFIGIIFHPIDKMAFFIIIGAWIKILCAVGVIKYVLLWLRCTVQIFLYHFGIYLILFVI